jgi:hypothetical protein
MHEAGMKSQQIAKCLGLPLSIVYNFFDLEALWCQRSPIVGLKNCSIATRNI